MMNITTLGASEMSISQVQKALNVTDLRAGLTWQQASSRRLVYGLNRFDTKSREPLFQKFIDQFKNPLILMLLASALISVMMTQYDDACSITAALLIVITVAFIQEYRSEKSLNALNNLLPHTCNCIRSGVLSTFLAENLVPGDIVDLRTGDRVPADIRLLEVNSLQVDESSFTGETRPAKKCVEPCSGQITLSTTQTTQRTADYSDSLSPPDHHMSADQRNVSSCIVYLGTLVRHGSAKGIVVATGPLSHFGDLFYLMRNEQAPTTPLQRSMNRLGQQLSYFSACIICVIMLIGWLQGKPLLEMFNIGVSLAVAAIPEGLPIVVTVTLALGVIRMSKKNAIVKRLPTVETLGGVDVICCDKTGTLTTNEMTVMAISLPNGMTVDVLDGLLTVDSCYEQSDNNDAWKRDVNYLVQSALLCSDAYITYNSEDSAPKAVGSATELAIAKLSAAMSLVDVRRSYSRIYDEPFSSETKYMQVVCKPLDDQQQGVVRVCKGALECVMQFCDSDLQPESLMRVRAAAAELGRRGLRVLCVARRDQLDHESYTQSRLHYIGLFGIMDPPRTGVRDHIVSLLSSGVSVKMLTGDSCDTACAIGKQLGLQVDAGSLISGVEIDRWSEEYLMKMVDHITIFYRMSPRHKLTIIKVLQSLDHVVAMTGDGVNDGVALKKADIGIAMGFNGTDVCKEAADMILVDDQFDTIINAIEEGRGIFCNICNFVQFQLSTSVAALFLVAISTLTNNPNPLNPMQILWINIIMDGPPAQSLGVEPVDMDLLRRHPRSLSKSVMSPHLLVNVFVSAIIIIVGTLCIFQSEMSDNVITPRDTTMTFTCFVFFDMFNALSCRSQSKSVFHIGLFTNRIFVISVTASLIGQFMVIYFGPLQRIFQTEALFISDLVFLFCLSSSVLVVSEIRKYLSTYSNRGSYLTHLFSKKHILPL